MYKKNGGNVAGQDDGSNNGIEAEAMLDDLHLVQTEEMVWYGRNEENLRIYRKGKTVKVAERPMQKENKSKRKGKTEKI